MGEGKIFVRDVRSGTFRIDDAFADFYQKALGPYTTAVYVQLCRYSNKAQEAWPSMERLAERSGISRRQVVKAIAALEESEMIAIIRGKATNGRQAVNVYVLLDKSQWRKPADRVHRVHAVPGARHDRHRVHGPSAPGALEVNTRKETQSEGKKKTVDKPASDVKGQLDEVRRELEARGILRPRPKR